MATMNCETSGKTIILSGDMTFNYQKMKTELASRFHGMFGDIKKLIPKLTKDHPKMTRQNIIDLINKGTTKDFYNKNNIWGYICIRPSDYANFIFSHMDSENRDNNYNRIRMGVSQFFDDNFDVYIILCAR
jgi:hypothetical protein